ncbi:hypothetical protein [Pontiella sulfatireligans]|uniref:Uncharacterized protein n=1 Tax=Pontiella sulfatireligans TaxID=2750658 RepID=A0A6C2UQ40_9BACT|nr:hypothetical protein [Pontiella sulfatireligans]VGO21126.1 hypothetical protein SCARR_03196 [Pontiella sulfatireligans]
MSNHPTCTRCAASFDPDRVDIHLGDPMEGLCESCFQHVTHLRDRADTALDRLSVRWAHGIKTADIEHAVHILELLTGLDNKQSLALAKRTIDKGERL